MDCPAAGGREWDAGFGPPGSSYDSGSQQWSIQASEHLDLTSQLGIDSRFKEEFAA